MRVTLTAPSTAALLLLLSGCAMGPEIRQLALPAALAGNEMLAVSPPLGQIQDEVSFGRYHALAVKRGPVLRDGAEWLTLDRRTDAFQETSFRLAEDGGAPPRAVSCRSALKTPVAQKGAAANDQLVLSPKALGQASASQPAAAEAPAPPEPAARPAAPTAVLECSILLSAESLASARLHLEDGVGTLELPQGKLRVEPANAQAPQSGAVGTVLSLNDAPVAAVQWADQGSVWLARDLPADTEAAVAATVAALLLVPGLR